ncbi:hypothetical protein [Leptolyngbya sp. 7M]|nr:hypothetical protein [Leptolyngbya sp. 7M]
MDAVRILHNPTDVTWDYDEEADVLYVSVGLRQPASRHARRENG